MLTVARLPASLREQLEAAARTHGVSVSVLVNRAVADLLPRLPPPDTEAR
ncbi:hypothetical protein BH18ACT1_BH18ACT1_07590 [soil metagenome]